MPRGHLVRLTLLLVVLLSPAGVHPLFAQTAAELFDPTVLQEIRLFMNSRDLRQLREHYQDRTHYTADLLWRDTRIRNAAVRSRGTGSANPNQAGAARRVRPLHHRPAFPRTADAGPRQPLAGSRDDPRACGDGDVHPPGPACPAPVVLPALHQQSVPGCVRGDRGAQRGIRHACARGNRRLRVRIPLAAPVLRRGSRGHRGVRPVVRAADARARGRLHACTGPSRSSSARRISRTTPSGASAWSSISTCRSSSRTRRSRRSSRRTTGCWAMPG